MLNHASRAALAASLLATLTFAQNTLVAPAGYAAAEGNSNNIYPWGRNSSSMRFQQIYDSSNFTSQSVTSPILISRLRFRANATTASWAGGSWPNVQIDLSTAAVDFLTYSSTFAANHGPDQMTVLNGAVAVTGGTGNGTTTPGPWYIDIPFTTPFVYDPTTGNDLCVDVMLDGTGWSGASTATDNVSSSGTPPPLGSRVYNSSSHTATTASGSTANYTLVTEFTYVPASGLYPAFTATPTTGPSPLTVQFTDQTFTSDPGGVVAWQWDFNGDSVIDSTVQNPSFTYTNCGSFNVSLTAVDATHGPVTRTVPNFITTDTISADFTYAVIAANVVQFTDLSTPTPTSWAWDFDNDSVVDSTAQNPAFAYPPNTPLTPVTLTASRLCGPPDSVTKGVLATTAIATTLVGGNGLSASGAGNVFDLQVTNPLGINVTSVDVTPWATTAGPVTCDIYLTDDTSGYASNHANQALWRLVGTGSGNAQVSNSTAPVPIHMTLNQRFYIAPGSYSMAIHMTGCGIVYTTGNGTNQVYSNADVSISCGLGKSTPFATGANNPRVWNGILYYDLCNLGGLAGYGFFGAGCAGSTGVTNLDATALPILGQTLTVQANNLPQNAGIMLLGFSRTNSAFGPLPLNLGILGAPGCFGRVSTDGQFLVIGAGNQASFNVPIPNLPALMCVQFYNQMLVLDPAANGLGAVASDAAAGIVGN